MSGPELLRLTPTESIAIRSSGARGLEVEATYGPGGKAPPKHLHPAQAEHFEVLEGRLTTIVDGDRRELGPGDELETPAGVVHQMWNEGAAEARVRWLTTPAGRTEQWFRAIDAAGGGRGEPSPLPLAVALDEYRDTFRLAVAPDVVLRPAIALVAAIGRTVERRTTNDE